MRSIRRWAGADRDRAAGGTAGADRPGRGVCAAGADGGAGAGPDVRSAGAAGESRRHRVPCDAGASRLEGDRGWQVAARPARRAARCSSGISRSTRRFTVTLAADVALSTKPYFSPRRACRRAATRLSDPSQFGRPASTPPLRAVGRYVVDGVPVEIRETVRRREAKLPYGDVLREVRTRAAHRRRRDAAARRSCRFGRRPAKPARAQLELEVTLLHNAETSAGQVALRMPAGWTAEPASQPFSFARAGERAPYRFTVRPASIDARSLPDRSGGDG